MNREELPQEASREDKMRDALKHYEELATKACWHRSDIPDAIRAYYASLPPAEGAETILKEGLDDGRYADITDGINIDVKQPFYQAIIRYAEDVVAAQQQPTAEGAEEILDKYPHSIEYPSFVHENSAIAAMTEFATLHAQRIADKMKEVNQFILDIAGVLGIETDGVGFDGLTLSIDDFKEAADKMVSERLREELIKYETYFGDPDEAEDVVYKYLKSREK